MKRQPVTTLRKGYSEFKYRQNAKGVWEEKGPMAVAWNRVRTSWPEQTVKDCIERLKAQGYEVEVR